VSWKLLVKHWPAPAQCSLLALLLLLCATSSDWTAEPSGAPIVLEPELPPSASPEAVRGLIADLAAKGAHPATQPTTTSGAAAQPAFNAANVAAQAWSGGRRAVQALPFLRRAPQIWVEQVETAGGTPEVAFARVLDGRTRGSRGCAADRGRLPHAG
jgi:hypothetical protein